MSSKEARKAERLQGPARKEGIHTESKWRHSTIGNTYADRQSFSGNVEPRGSPISGGNKLSKVVWLYKGEIV